MRNSIRAAVLGLGMVAIAGPAAAQFGGPPQPPVAAPLWALDVPFAAKDPVLFADLDIGGPAGFTGVIKGGQLCYSISVPGVTDATSANILLDAGAKVVVPLKAPADGASGGCVALSVDLATSLATSPGDYTVNVVSKSLPVSAAHGKLEARGAGQKWADKNL